MKKIKDITRAALQKIMGYHNYLFVFSVFNIKRIEKGHHEADFLYFVNMMPNRGAILDIGANIGIMTTVLARRLDRVFVYAFEPIPDNLRALKRVRDHYSLKNIKVIETALGETAGETRMVVPVLTGANMQGLSHIVEEGKEPEGYMLTVPVQRLDDVPEVKDLPEIVAIKIDVENFEYYVLKGAQQLLQKHRPLIYCELWNDEKRALCFDLLNSLGYKTAIYENGRLVDFAGQEVINFFFIPQ